VNEQEQWTRIVAGDAQAFTAFYQATAPRLLAFLQRMVGSRDAAEDVAQETYAGIWRHPGGTVGSAARCAAIFSAQAASARRSGGGGAVR
jgi:DNA-directed RNA polymerase specialized sigma24 family protein